MIRDEAVEAAAKAGYEARHEGGIWTMTDAEFKRELAKAWDEGYATCVDDMFRDSELVKRGSRLDEGTPNPYRSQA